MRTLPSQHSYQRPGSGRLGDRSKETASAVVALRRCSLLTTDPSDLSQAYSEKSRCGDWVSAKWTPSPARNEASCLPQATSLSSSLKISSPPRQPEVWTVMSTQSVIPMCAPLRGKSEIGAPVWTSSYVPFPLPSPLPSRSADSRCCGPSGLLSPLLTSLLLI